MAAKLLQSLTDDNLDLQKQIGCMTGIFQLFDRQHMFTGGRRIVGHTPKRLAGKSQFSNGNSERDASNGQLRSTSLEKYSNKNIQERQRVFTESSRASLSSSSRSSSFCSLDCNRTTQLEPTSFDGILFPETPSRDSAMSLLDTSPHLSRQVDLRHLVKDSMYREVQGSLVKAKSTEATDYVAKHRDSPRPPLKTGVGSYGLCPDKNPVTPADLKESLRVLAKLQEAPWYHNEPRELLRSASYHSKDGSSFSVPKDLPRFSYDGREMNRAPDVSKSSLRLKDLPRLSLDSREGSLRSLKGDSKSNIFVKTLQKDGSEFDRNAPSLQKSPGNQARPPSVVAKLMGLEALPDSVSSSETNVGSSRSYQIEDFANVARSFTNTDSSKPIQLLSSSSSKNLWKEPSSPRWRNPDASMKPMSRFPIEPAPWKHTDGTKSSQKPASRSTRGPAKTTTTVATVYSEIEKRLKDLEFTQSGKDLRALKQILESMQAKGLLETEKEGQGSNFASRKDHEQKFSSSIHDSRLLINRNSKTDQILASTNKRVVGSGRNYESPIVIMKPAKLVEKSGIRAASVLSLDGISGLPKHQDSNSVESRKGSSSGRTSNVSSTKSNQRENAVTSVALKNDRTSKAVQNSTSFQQLAKDNNASSGKSSGATSPRLQQKKAELEKRTRPPTNPPDSSKLRKQSNKQQTESVSPAGRRRSKDPSFHTIEEHPSEIHVEPRYLSYHESENSVQLTDSTINESRSTEVYSSERSTSTCDRQYPSMKASGCIVSGLAEKKSVLRLNDEEAAELACAPTEYSSPVSVLDVAANRDDSPSPVKYMGKTLKVDVSIDADKSASVQGSSMANCGLNSMEMGVTSEIYRKKLRNIENLVQKLRRINSSHDEARTDYIASLCENTDPDHRYISEILLASGLLLRDLGGSLTNFQFHPSGHPINPDLFLVLEQTKASTLLKEERSNRRTTAQMMSIDKFHRKLIFDTVNEILIQRLALSEPWPRTRKSTRRAVNGQKLLRDLCSEVEGLRAETSKCGGVDADEDGWKNILCQDLILRSESWTDFGDEISVPILDIERLIFKDLVDEIVIGESTEKMKSGRHSNHLSK